MATGSLAKIDPDRIMLKKVTGLPIRVRKRMAVIKHPFYNTNDVRWFACRAGHKARAEGHIKEPVSTHGLFKCIFSAPSRRVTPSCSSSSSASTPKWSRTR